MNTGPRSVFSPGPRGHSVRGPRQQPRAVALEPRGEGAGGFMEGSPEEAPGVGITPSLDGREPSGFPECRVEGARPPPRGCASLLQL